MQQQQGDSVKIDLVIGDETDPSGEDLEESTATEVICLRILSNRTKFRFNGMEITVKSPAFEVGKTFAVNLDEENRLAGIETFKEYYPVQVQNNHHHRSHRHQNETSDRTSSPVHSGSSSRSTSPSSRPCSSSTRRVSLVNSLGIKPARILVNASDETESNEGLPLLSARIALEEDFLKTKAGESSLSSPHTPSSPSSTSFFRRTSKKNKNPTTSLANSVSPRNGSPLPLHRMFQQTCSLSSPPVSLSPPTSPSPFRRTPSPARISKLIGEDYYEPQPGDLGYSSYSKTTGSTGKSFVSVGVGTTSNPKESLYFAMEGTFRRSNSWKK